MKTRSSAVVGRVASAIARNLHPPSPAGWVPPLPQCPGLSAESLAVPKGATSPPGFRLGRPCAGHPRLGSGRGKDVDTRIKSAQDDFNSFPASLKQVIIARKFSRTAQRGAGEGTK